MIIATNDTGKRLRCPRCKGTIEPGDQAAAVKPDPASEYAGCCATVTVCMNCAEKAEKPHTEENILKRIQLCSIKDLDGIEAVCYCYDCKKRLAGNWEQTGAVEDSAGLHVVCDDCYSR